MISVYPETNNNTCKIYAGGPGQPYYNYPKRPTGPVLTNPAATPTRNKEGREYIYKAVCGLLHGMGPREEVWPGQEVM